MGELIKQVLIAFCEYIKFWYQVEHWEEAVMLRWGKYRKILKPGWYWKWPVADFGLSTNVKDDTLEVDPISITTLDGKTISIGIMMGYRVKDVKLFLVEHNNSLSNFVDICKGELSDAVEDLNWDELRKKPTRTSLKNKLKPHAESLGIELNEMKFTDKCQVRSFKLFTANNKVVDKPTLV